MQNEKLQNAFDRGFMKRAQTLGLEKLAYGLASPMMQANNVTPVNVGGPAARKPITQGFSDNIRVLGGGARGFVDGLGQGVQNIGNFASGVGSAIASGANKAMQGAQSAGSAIAGGARNLAQGATGAASAVREGWNGRIGGNGANPTAVASAPNPSTMNLYGPSGATPAPGAGFMPPPTSPNPSGTLANVRRAEPNFRPSPSAPAPAAPQGPSDAYLAKVMGSYNPNSALDQRKAEAIRQIYQPGMTANQIYANPAYAAASRNPGRMVASR
jgi:hypothetical protein